ncbi:MAG: hypothetical protein Q8N17_25455 [Burkholderiaceae bacterium]|nr:hypothetical protein [Burkholderiaceae bacterium]
MIHAVNSGDVLAQRRLTQGVTGNAHWRTDFLGQASDGRLKESPQAYLLEMTPGEVLLAHFHAVDQFQIFVAGSGNLGRTHTDVTPVLVHYADHHTGYGPIEASAQGFSYFTLRARSDSGVVYLHHPGYRDKLLPSRRRHFTASLRLSTAPVLAQRTDTEVSALYPQDMAVDDGLGAFLYRMGPGLSLRVPQAAAASGGQYLLVLNGSVQHGGKAYPAWSVLYSDPAGDAMEVSAGAGGAEWLFLQFPATPQTGTAP